MIASPQCLDRSPSVTSCDVQVKYSTVETRVLKVMASPPCSTLPYMHILYLPAYMFIAA